MDSELDDLELDLMSLTRSGRGSAKLEAEYIRDLTPADLAMPKSAIQTARPIAKIRDSHHALARVLASGQTEAEASIVTGYSASRISILKADPQFQELLEFYRRSTVDIVADYRQRMVNLGLDAMQELEDRLDESPEQFSPALLKDIVKDMADRTGHAPNKGSPININIDAGLTERIKSARARVEAMRTIEHE